MNFRYVGVFAIVSIISVTACIAATNKPEQTKSVGAKEISLSVQAKNKETAAPIILAEADTPADASPTQTLGADGFPLPQQKKALGDAPPPPADVMTPLERVKVTPIGQLKNPYANDPDMPKWGQKRFMGNSCNGCHGGTGGGGMCPPLSNETWVYGSDDDTLFRLIALGSDGLQKHLGTGRKGRENVVGPMPAFGEIIKTDDEIWRIISFIRTTYRGDPSRKNW